MAPFLDWKCNSAKTNIAKWRSRHSNLLLPRALNHPLDNALFEVECILYVRHIVFIKYAINCRLELNRHIISAMLDKLLYWCLAKIPPPRLPFSTKTTSLGLPLRFIACLNVGGFRKCSSRMCFRYGFTLWYLLGIWQQVLRGAKHVNSELFSEKHCKNNIPWTNHGPKDLKFNNFNMITMSQIGTVSSVGEKMSTTVFHVQSSAF